jgi:hypothetical protein
MSFFITAGGFDCRGAIIRLRGRGIFEIKEMVLDISRLTSEGGEHKEKEIRLSRRIMALELRPYWRLKG